MHSIHDAPDRPIEHAPQPQNPLPERELRKRAAADAAMRLIVGLAFLFCITVLAVCMADYGDPRSATNAFLQRWGVAGLIAEAGLLLPAGIVAIWLDKSAPRRADGNSAAQDGRL